MSQIFYCADCLLALLTGEKSDIRECGFGETIYDGRLCCSTHFEQRVSHLVEHKRATLAAQKVTA